MRFEVKVVCGVSGGGIITFLLDIERLPLFVTLLHISFQIFLQREQSQTVTTVPDLYRWWNTI